MYCYLNFVNTLDNYRSTVFKRVIFINNCNTFSIMLLEPKIFLIDSTVQLQIHIVCNRVLYCTVHCGEKGDKREGKQRIRWSGIIRILPPTNWIPGLMICTLRTSVPDPDLNPDPHPHLFGLPESGSESIS
jgi:hypothetical protein